MKPDIELVLGVRSFERIVVVASTDSDFQYPSHWERPLTFADMVDRVGPDSVVVVDRVDLTRRALASIASRQPRLIAMAPGSVERIKAFMRSMTVLYPWSEVWQVQSSFGQLLVTKDAQGQAYDRQDVIDLSGRSVSVRA